MSTFDYGNTKEMALRLVEKFGTDCKVSNATRTYSAKAVFMTNAKGTKDEGASITQNKRVYVCGISLEINPTNTLTFKNTVYLITGVEQYNFDGKTKVLYVLDVAK